MRIPLLAMLLLLAACASSGVLTVDRDTYMISKRSAQVGFGPPVAATAYVYRQANAYCSKKGGNVETLNLDQVDSGFGRPSSASLKFRCVADANAK
jgi:putative hemolysin